MARKRLLEQVRDRIRTLHYSRKTEQSYCYWIRYFIRFHRYQHPSQLIAKDVTAFLTFLAVKRRVSAATQNQAFNAIIFLYNKVPGTPLEQIEGVTRAKRSRRLPVVFTRHEVHAVMAGAKPPD